jgi:hypothetical protein
MGNSQSDSIGKKISDGFNVMGKKMGEGWGEVTNFGNKVWNGIKSVPVIGKIAEGVEKYTPIGIAATNILRGTTAGITGASKVLQGDFKGALDTGLNYAKDRLTQGNPLSNLTKDIPIVGGLISAPGKTLKSKLINTMIKKI